MKKICLQCKKEYNARENKYKFCSRDCSNRASIGRKAYNKGTKGIMKPNKTSFKKGNFIPHRTGCNCMRCNPLKWKEINLGRKHTIESRINMGLPKKGIIPKNIFGKGEKNPNWCDGKSFEEYGLEFNEDLKEVVRNRDRRKCRMCGKTELENGEKLTVHHIDYDKKNNNPINLISLCRSSHTETNHNRPYWIEYFAKFLITQVEE